MLYDQIQQATQFLRSRFSKVPKVGIILGTGLGGIGDDIQDKVTLPYEEIPHFPRSTVETHKGQFICGTLGGKTVLAMEGRFHFYEGYTMQQVTFPVPA